MLYKYLTIDLQTGTSWLSEAVFSSYMEYVGELEAMNNFWKGELKFREVRQSSLLTNEFDTV